MNTKILILGKKGQLAQSLINFFKKRKIKFKTLSSNELNFLDPKKINNKLNSINFKILINCFAFTNVDLAEIEKKKCKLINATSVKKIADYCKLNDKVLIHFSTDYVFNKIKKIPITEKQNHSPINYYGKTKSLSESYIISSECKFLIFRISWTYSKYGKNFVKTVVKKLKNGEKLRVIDDQYGCPTNLDYVCLIVYKFLLLIKKKKYQTKDIWHISHKGVTNWYLFAKEIQNYFSYSKDPNKIYSIKSKDYKSLAKRPKYSKLSSNKLDNFLGITVKDNHWKIQLNKFMKNNFNNKNLLRK